MLLSVGNYENVRFLGFLDVFGFANSHPAGNRTLWFMRSLIVFTLVAGSVDCVACRFRCRWVWYGGYILLIIALKLLGYPIGNGSAPVWFFLGYVFSGALLRGAFEIQGSYRRVVVAGMFTMGCVFHLLYFKALVSGGRMSGWSNLATGCTIAFLWLILEEFKGIDFSRFVLWVSPILAFVYFSHWPLLRFHIMKLEAFSWLLHFNRDAAFMTLIVFAPLLMIVIAMFLKCFFPRLFFLLNGRRT